MFWQAMVLKRKSVFYINSLNNKVYFFGSGTVSVVYNQAEQTYT
jgi:hypothetical protein